MSDQPYKPEKAYKNLRFLTSKNARSIRILSEYIEPATRFDHYDITDTVILFGSARAIPSVEAKAQLEAANQSGDEEAIVRAKRAVRLSRFYDETCELAHRLTNWSKALPGNLKRFIITSGGGPGLMEAANRGASEAKGQSIGLGISLPMEPGINSWATRELSFEFHYFFMRKFWFVYLSKAAIVLPGGFGTLDELFEMLTLVQTKKISRPLPVILYGREFWDSILDLEALKDWGTISPEDLNLFKVCDTVDEAFETLTSQLAELYPDVMDGTSDADLSSTLSSATESSATDE